MKTLSILSFVANTIIWIMVHIDKRVQAHPYKLIALIAFFDSMAFWYISCIDRICDFHLN